MKVFLDAGHGGRDPGAIGNDLLEKDIALSVALKVGEILKRHDIDVEYSRATDVFLELYERSAKANNAKADLFVSIHCNAASSFGAQGVETYYYPGSEKGMIIAKCIQDNIIQSKVFTQNRGTKTADFAVLRQTKMPAALVEMGFISNVQDSEILKNRQDELAEAIAKGILDYLGVKYISLNKKTDGKDKPSDWAQTAWEWAKEEGLLDGTRPKDPLTREEFAVVLKKLSGQNMLEGAK